MLLFLEQVSFGVQGCVSERGTAAVIDGARLLVTPLRLAVVPPPLSAAVLTTPAPIFYVAIRDFTDAEVQPCWPPTRLFFSCHMFPALPTHAGM